MTTKTQLKGCISLYRYYLIMEHMRSRFMEELGCGNWHEHLAKHPEHMEFIIAVHPPAIYLSVWKSTLYVLIEGWQKLKFHDDEIDALLDSKNVALLKLHRNGTFHFQKALMPEKCLKLIASPDAVEWVNTLADAFRRYFDDLGKTPEFEALLKEEMTVK